MTAPRTNVLNERHVALGASFDEWNDLDIVSAYRTDPAEEHAAVRHAAGLIDMSGLKKVHVTGPDALSVCDHVCTRDLTRIEPGQAVYALVLTDEGGITDDCILFHRGPNDWLFVHGGGHGLEMIRASAEGRDVSLTVDDTLNILSVQGPKALDILNGLTRTPLANLSYYWHCATTLAGCPVMISRTGYSGERGYEVFVAARDAGSVWDAIMEAGARDGLLPCSFTCIDLIRVEAGLLFYPFDMSEGDTPSEAGLTFAVSKGKQAEFRGKSAVLAKTGKESRRMCGLRVDGESAVNAGAKVVAEGAGIGEVTTGIYSTILKESLAFAWLAPEFSSAGTEIVVQTDQGEVAAIVDSLPFYDPGKKKRTAV